MLRHPPESIDFTEPSMIRKLLRRVLVCVLCLSLLPTNIPARASDSLQTTANEIAGGIIAVTAAIAVVAVVLVVHYKPATIKGCVASGPNGLELFDSSDKLTWELAGVTSDIKPGEVVKLKGKKKHGKGGAPSTFTVKESGKNYGACPATTNP
jgi:hypothetical protein